MSNTVAESYFNQQALIVALLFGIGCFIGGVLLGRWLWRGYRQRAHVVEAQLSELRRERDELEAQVRRLT